MSLSMYQASVPIYGQILTSLSNLLKKGAASAETRKIDPSVLLNARIAPDMFPLVRQVQTATDHAKGSLARLASVEIPAYPDTETTFDELQARIAKTLDYVKTFKPDQIDGTEDKDIVLKFGPQKFPFKGQAYLLNFVLPNFYFHTSMAYAILRHNGVDIGKRDFLGR
ncbi:MAG TPA: DUF1993 domain-containing protein [Rhizomicrobium sp.]|nr:DUF1993 domain-containing protein [Rhizomicrobium sp.]